MDRDELNAIKSDLQGMIVGFHDEPLLVTDATLIRDLLRDAERAVATKLDILTKYIGDIDDEIPF
jgi:hypothetical protein